MTQIHVRPARHDLRVPTGLRPGEYFPDEPTPVARDRYIDRRLADGDLIEVPAPELGAGKKSGKE